MVFFSLRLAYFTSLALILGNGPAGLFPGSGRFQLSLVPLLVFYFKRSVPACAGCACFIL